MDQRVVATASGVLWTALALSFLGCVAPQGKPTSPPATGSSAGVMANPSADSPAGPTAGPTAGTTAGGTLGPTAGAAGGADGAGTPAAAALDVPAVSEPDAAARQLAEMIGLLSESEGAPLIAAYAESNGVDGAAEILVRLKPELRSKLIRELQQSNPDEVAEYMEALAKAAAAAMLTNGQLREDAGKVVDDWHAAAARGDRDGYLGRMAPDARFLGTDALERWDLEQFTDYVNKYFAPGRGWAFLPDERVLQLSASGTVAWFDELLASESYGELRGTGVLVRAGDVWKVAQYSMTFTVPNDVAENVVDAVSRSEQ